MYELIDSHCHIQIKNFDRDRQEVIRRAISNGVVGIVVSGYDISSNHKALNLKSSNIFATLGFSPTMNTKGHEHVISQIMEHQNEIVAVGEVGIDRVKGRLPFDEQKKIFESFLRLASEMDKPVVIHARDAEIEAIDLASRYGVKAMIHCFNGSLKAFRLAKDSGAIVSISTMVTFSDRLKRVVREMDLENVVIETDSPFLSPKRGRNEPANLVYAVNEISKLIEEDKEEVARITKRNAEDFYGISV
ncbi:hydrolase, TatD family [Archaeoglobus sulfaticallidus PM70-1]|uniref:Hydrolase, TatD family n=1 Tax=Archaeoglobus sulfaticallidus PM70-1 TaxID=387631 RepID=N0BIA1_9EURY|nr:TatD family hydrolase [Archaeoglobus sulfaticallidus]AGK60191.1 hydrolase, TatD family [Archaeoglobus sulfaticallidus PM70-1]